MAYLSIYSYQGHVRYLRETKSYLFYLHATSKNEIHICSNKHETCLVLSITICCILLTDFANFNVIIRIGTPSDSRLVTNGDLSVCA